MQHRPALLPQLHHYDMIVAHQCRERRAEPVDEKDRNNYCEYFDFARRNFKKIERSEGKVAKTRPTRRCASCWTIRLNHFIWACFFLNTY